MAEIIDLQSRVEETRQDKDIRLRRMKIESLRRHFQCMRCAFRCFRCGSQLKEEDRNPGKPYRAPYVFCRVCYEEYMEYRKRKEGSPGTSEYYWHNGLWMELWDAWLRYQETMERYRQSPEFFKLLEEVEGLIER